MGVSRGFAPPPMIRGPPKLPLRVHSRLLSVPRTEVRGPFGIRRPAGATQLVMFHLRAFSTPWRLTPRLVCGFVAPRNRPWGSPRLARAGPLVRRDGPCTWIAFPAACPPFEAFPSSIAVPRHRADQRCRRSARHQGRFPLVVSARSSASCTGLNPHAARSGSPRPRSEELVRVLWVQLSCRVPSAEAESASRWAEAHRGPQQWPSLRWVATQRPGLPGARRPLGFRAAWRWVPALLASAEAAADRCGSPRA